MYCVLLLLSQRHIRCSYSPQIITTPPVPLALAKRDRNFGTSQLGPSPYLQYIAAEQNFERFSPKKLIGYYVLMHGVGMVIRNFGLGKWKKK